MRCCIRNAFCPNFVRILPPPFPTIRRSTCQMLGRMPARMPAAASPERQIQFPQDPGSRSTLTSPNPRRSTWIYPRLNRSTGPPRLRRFTKSYPRPDRPQRTYSRSGRSTWAYPRGRRTRPRPGCRGMFLALQNLALQNLALQNFAEFSFAEFSVAEFWPVFGGAEFSIAEFCRI